MEHRYSQRTHASAKLMIYKKGVPVALGRASNVSRHGLFVLTDYTDFNLHQFLEVEILSEHNHFGSQRLKTIVVHKAQQGFGAEIDEDSALGKIA
jgi:hypothetical protein